MKLSHVPVGVLVMFGVLQGCASSAPDDGKDGKDESTQADDLSLPADPNRCANGGLKPRCEVLRALDCRETRTCYAITCSTFFGRWSSNVSRCNRCPAGYSDNHEELQECQHAEPAPH